MTSTQSAQFAENARERPTKLLTNKALVSLIKITAHFDEFQTKKYVCVSVNKCLFLFTNNVPIANCLLYPSFGSKINTPLYFNPAAVWETFPES